MARKTSDPSVTLPTITLSQQALHLLRQIVIAQGWAKTILDIHVGGKLLAETLPEIDPIDWVRPEEQVLAMTPEQRTVYLEKDAAWGAKKVTFSTSSQEKGVIQRAFQHFAATAASAKQLGPNQFLLEIIVAFEVKDSSDGAASG